MGKISVEPMEDGLGIKTKAPLQHAELVFEIPKGLVVSVENARNSKLCKLL